MQKGGFVYIISSPNKASLYTGVTSDLKSRIWEHRNKTNPKSFTAQYNCVVLVYYKFYETIEVAIIEEKRIKGRNRKQKEALIDGMNREWADLWAEIERW